MTTAPARPGIAGAVLAGGASTRFGRDKAQVVVDGSTMLQRSLASLAPHCGSLVVVGAEPPAHAGAPTVRRVDDLVPGGGALSGLHAALSCAPPGTRWVLVAACDMPFLTPQTWTPILDAAAAIDRDGAASVAVVPESAHGLEPLAAAYRPAVAADAHRALLAGRRSLRALLAGIDVRIVPSTAFGRGGGRDPFTNVNRPSDLDDATDLDGATDRDGATAADG